MALGERVALSPETIFPQLTIAAAGAKPVSAYALELSWTTYTSAALYVFLSGGYPGTAGEVALSQAVADELGVATGDVVTLGLRPTEVRVTGVYRPTTDHQSLSALLSPGTWEYVDAESDAQPIILFKSVLIGQRDGPALDPQDVERLRAWGDLS